MARSAKAQPNKREPGPFAGLTFAVYARVSRDDDRAEEHTSPARQISQATTYVEERGGRVDPAHVYSDEGVSGAEFRNRHGLLRLLAALDGGQPPFNALVMSEESRLGREQVETAYILKRILDAGVRVFYYMADQERRLDSAQDKIMASLALFGAELEREKARQRARDKALAQVRAGQVAGGEPYGYENVHWKDGREVPRGQPHDYVTRRIKEEEAEVVRGVFKMYAAGYGMVAIAKTMNGVPAYGEQFREFFAGQPPAPPRQRTGSWAPAAIREMLYRRAYHGERVWGRTGKAERNGQARRATRRPEREWLVVPAPELKVVPDPLWEAVQRRLKIVNEDYLRDTRGKLWGKPDLRTKGAYLLSGLAMCGLCRWNLAVLGGVRRVYGCSHHHRRGVCGNDLAQPVVAVDAAFLGALEREVLTPERFLYAVQCAVDRIGEQLAREPDRGSALAREKAGLSRKIERMVAAIGDGRGPTALVREIERAEGRVKEMEADLARLAAAPAVADLDLKRIEREMEGQLSRFGDLLKGNVPRARQALKKLLVDRVEFTPVEIKGGDRTYAFKGELSYGAMLREVIYQGKFPLGTPRIQALTAFTVSPPAGCELCVTRPRAGSRRIASRPTFPSRKSLRSSTPLTRGSLPRGTHEKAPNVADPLAPARGQGGTGQGNPASFGKLSAQNLSDESPTGRERSGPEQKYRGKRWRSSAQRVGTGRRTGGRSRRAARRAT